jgi:hypothetical protein
MDDFFQLKMPKSSNVIICLGTLHIISSILFCLDYSHPKPHYFLPHFPQVIKSNFCSSVDIQNSRNKPHLVGWTDAFSSSSLEAFGYPWIVAAGPEANCHCWHSEAAHCCVRITQFI